MKKKKIYSDDLNIDLESKKDSELFKWFLACLLFGKPIQQEVAKRAYFEFIKLDVSKELKEKYDGKISNLLIQSKNKSDLENKLKEIKHIGPTTTRIFLRDLR